MLSKFSGWLFAILISYGAILPVLYGCFGVSDSKYATALALAAMIGGLFISGARSGFALTVPDCVFLLLCLSIATTFVTAPFSSDFREVILLVFSLSSYVAARSVSLSRMVTVRDACMSVSLFIVVVGGLLTLHALVQQWNMPHGKPIIFGFDNLVILFTQALAILAIAFTCTKQEPSRKSWVVVGIIVAGVCLFAASLVRATFISMAVGLAFAGLLHPSKTIRRRILAVVAAGMALVVVGLLARPGTGEMIVNYLFASSSGVPGFAGRPSCGLNIDIYNSVAIRKALYQDAVYLFPQAGFFGLGLRGFLVGTCLPNSEVHNVFVQAFVEFGRVGGSLLILLIGTCIVAAASKARTDDAARFVACGLAFFILVFSFHGEISRTIELFAFLGLAARYAQRGMLYSQ